MLAFVPTNSITTQSTTPQLPTHNPLSTSHAFNPIRGSQLPAVHFPSGSQGLSTDPLRSPTRFNRLALLAKKEGDSDKAKTPETSTIHAPFDLSKGGKMARQFTKNSLYAQIGLARAAGVFVGKQDPYIDFQVDDEPPSIFINYKLKPETVDAFRKEIGLPEHIALMPVTCTENGDPELMITLNAYHVSGITNGLRAEWSTYIDRGDGKPSFLVIDAHTDKASMDPVDIITMPSTFTYTSEEDGMKLDISTKKGEHFAFENPAIDTEGNAQQLPDRTWIAANDYIFWGNGVCDRVYYDGGLINSPLHVLDPEKSNITYDSKWSQFTEEKPFELLALASPARFVISPWFNLNDKHDIE